MQANTVLSYDPLDTDDDAGFEAVRRIYEHAIVASERKTAEELRHMIRREDYRFFVAREAGTVVGFSIAFVAKEEPLALLEYMAVAPEHRSRGLGAELFSATVRSLLEGAPGCCILLEVDSPREASPDQQLRVRRQDFYRRLGCRRVDDLHYILPLPGNMPQMDLFLYVDAPPPLRVSREQVRRWLQIVYDRVYECSREDPRIGRMLHGTPEHLPLI
ncbi:GNAT family N-acetyltransferase [Archangium sp.]|uniref:GNAT family N-acetyltransferase n=1 Tax=Archangium sp. TaxID=1872627 RepID=UPI002D5E86FC|nr:GNAT family N-acetyltransferase [Archangium sp.]HYO57147.1 GNAT family N-acetyltransferase [Archangium sp.]